MRLLTTLSLLALAAPAFAQTASTLDKVKASGAITLAYRESSIPFSYLDDKAQPVGFAHEICLKIIDDVKKAVGRPDLKVNLQAVTSANRIPLLQNGTIDIECGSTTNNSARGKQVQFATNYFYTGTKFLVKTGTTVKTIDDLKGKTIVSTTVTTNYQILRNLNEEKKLGMELLGAHDVIVELVAPEPARHHISGEVIRQFDKRGIQCRRSFVDRVRRPPEGIQRGPELLRHVRLQIGEVLNAAPLREHLGYR